MSEYKRFLIVEKSDPVSMRVVTDKEVSDRIDMEDCNDGEFEVFYLNDDGTLEKIKVANFVQASEESWENGVAGWADLVTADTNKVVGTLTKTDH
jgi:hypothetical protein